MISNGACWGSSGNSKCSTQCSGCLRVSRALAACPRIGSRCKEEPHTSTCVIVGDEIYIVLDSCGVGHGGMLRPDGETGWPVYDYGAQLSCQTQPGFCGTFKQAGEQVSITMNGRTRVAMINSAPGGYQVNGLATIKAESMAGGTKLSGNYSGSGPQLAGSTGSGNSVSSAHSYALVIDGVNCRLQK